MHRLYLPVAALMREVGETIVMPRFQALAAHEVREKTPGDLVTIADAESEARLGEGLAALLPEAVVVGEEAVAADPTILDDLDRGARWLIDPLDGTLNFTEGKRPFAIMIALVAEGEPVAGWILDPVTGRMCHAAKGDGAFVNDERVFTSPTGAARPIAAIAPYFLPPERRAEIEARAAGKLDIVAIPRCAGEQYPRLVLGENDVTLFERSHPWDHAAGALLLAEAGGRIARTDGTPYKIWTKGAGLLAAASPALWDEAAAILFD
jgi:fructose-1,6-bisphosphatase/inositol monophosphatase family enzyme